MVYTIGDRVVIVAVIVLMIIRLIADAMDLNPFAWASRTIHRLTDGLVIPVRGGLRNVGADPKFAPLVVILVAILLGFFFAWLAETILVTIMGVIDSTQRGAIIATAWLYCLWSLVDLPNIDNYARCFLDGHN